MQKEYSSIVPNSGAIVTHCSTVPTDQRQGDGVLVQDKIVTEHLTRRLPFVIAYTPTIHRTPSLSSSSEMIESLHLPLCFHLTQNPFRNPE
jgi:hypothetical protein